MPLRGRIEIVERQKEGGCGRCGCDCGVGAGWSYVRNPGPGQERQCSPSTKLITACVVSAQKNSLKSGLAKAD